jgi:hypothetical protein
MRDQVEPRSFERAPFAAHPAPKLLDSCTAVDHLAIQLSEAAAEEIRHGRHRSTNTQKTVPQ